MAQKIYVAATDKFMSGWGRAEGKINRIVFECDGWDEANRVADMLEARGDMIRVRTSMRRPSYPTQSHYTQYKTPAEFGIKKVGEML